MYIPESNRVEDRELALELMKANPFATVVSAAEGEPFATHVPVLASQAEGRILLRAHVARANPHWKMLAGGGQTLVIFHGPHAYISPSLYGSRESVPTWNYAAVHAYGPARVFERPEPLTEVLLETFACFEPAYLNQWRDLNQKFRARLLSQIVGFEIVVERLEAKFKLSQNRPRADQARVIQSLEASSDSAASGITRLMKDLGLGS